MPPLAKEVDNNCISIHLIDMKERKKCCEELSMEKMKRMDYGIVVSENASATHLSCKQHWTSFFDGLHCIKLALVFSSYFVSRPT